MNLNNFKSVKILFLASLLFTLFSCAKEETINSSFERKYGREIQRMREMRGLDRMGKAVKRDPLANPQYSSPPSRAEIERQMAGNGGYNSYSPIQKIGQAPRQDYRPNAEIYQTQRRNNPSRSLPDDMFYITYNNQLHPPFKRIGQEFDYISIPEYDAYGVETEMANKQYLLAGNNAVQKSLDKIRSARSEDDVAISKSLIKEIKEEKKQKRTIRIFGRNLLSSTVEVEEINFEEEVENDDLAQEEQEKIQEIKGKEMSVSDAKSDLTQDRQEIAASKISQDDQKLAAITKPKR